MFENLNLDNLTPRARQVLAFATREAGRDGGGIAHDGHVLIGLLHLAQGGTAAVLGKKITCEQARQILSTIKNPPISLDEVVTLAQTEAVNQGHSYVGTEHILIGLLEVGKVTKVILESAKVDLMELKDKVRRIFLNNPPIPQQAKLPEPGLIVGSGPPILYNLFWETALRQLIEILDMNPEDFAEGSRLKGHAYLFVLWAAEELNKHLIGHVEISETGKQEIVRVVQKAKMTIQISLPCLPPETESSETYRNLNEILAKVSKM